MLLYKTKALFLSNQTFLLNFNNNLKGKVTQINKKKLILFLPNSKRKFFLLLLLQQELLQLQTLIR